MKNLDYGIIGNCRTAALVSKEGSIDWCCLPNFNSSSILARILDTERGGFFGISPEGDYSITQRYFDRTNILLTGFQHNENRFEVIDFMPRYKTELGYYHTPPEIIRYVRHVSGKPRARFIYRPKLYYAQHDTQSVIEEDYIKSFTVAGKYESIYLYSDINLATILNEEEVVIDKHCFFLLSYNQKLIKLNCDRIHLEFERTKVYWLNWMESTRRFKKYNEEIGRSALVLKLLSYHKSGAILASITTSLPEIPGANRNWDYRFCWIRDASMIISTLTALGHYNSARRFLNFITDVIPYKDEKMQVMYGIHGEKRLIERELPWLSGYEGSRPVRIGNAAYLQKQNDIYGVLIDLFYQYFKLFKHTLSNSEEIWTIVRSLIKTVKNNWMKPDTGIWEFRTQKRHFTFSKMLSWVAIDRGVKIAKLLGNQKLETEWLPTRDAIKKNILKRGWNPAINAFTQYYDSSNMDAANLLMQFYGFISADDPKYISTVERIQQELCFDGLMYRYRNSDDFGEPKTSFTICTFWMIKSLYIIGKEKEAEDMFATVLGYANHLGLFSEGIDFVTKRLVGNFPQGYSHLALIDTAITLSGVEIDEENKLIHELGSYPHEH